MLEVWPGKHLVDYSLVHFASSPHSTVPIILAFSVREVPHGSIDVDVPRPRVEVAVMCQSGDQLGQGKDSLAAFHIPSREDGKVCNAANVLHGAV